MTIGLLLKVLALVLWLLAFALKRIAPQASNYDLVAAGLFFWFLPDVLNL